jgi:hypothetical protein
MTPRGIPALRMLPHMGPATTAPARSVNYIVNHMCEHICEPIQSTGRILPGGPGTRPTVGPHSIWRATGASLLANSMDRQRGVSPADRELTGTYSN